MKITIFDINTGRRLRLVECPSNMVDIQVGDTEYYEEGDIPSIHDESPITKTLRAMAMLKDKRYDVSVSGFVWNGWLVHSDMDSRLAAKDQCDEARAGRRASGDIWKFKDGIFRPLTNEQMINLYETGQAFVRKCFAVEVIGQQLISNGLYDIDAVWAQAWEMATEV